jgi:uncharacterized protein (DUF2267 family)
MKYERFIGLVQHRAKLPTTEDAVTAIRTTLETLAEKLSADEVKDLGSQLPREIRRFLTLSTNNQQGFHLAEFFSRVAERECRPISEATYHARVVIEVLTEAVSAGEIGDVRRQLPADFAPLFDAGSTGPLFG